MQHIGLPALVVEKDEGYQLEGWISVIRHCSEVTQYPIKSIEDAQTAAHDVGSAVSTSWWRPQLILWVA